MVISSRIFLSIYRNIRLSIIQSALIHDKIYTKNAFPSTGLLEIWVDRHYFFAECLRMTRRMLLAIPSKETSQE